MQTRPLIKTSIFKDVKSEQKKRIARNIALGGLLGMAALPGISGGINAFLKDVPMWRGAISPYERAIHLTRLRLARRSGNLKTFDDVQTKYQASHAKLTPYPTYRKSLENHDNYLVRRTMEF